jgi:ubiquinone/menaquinone biosynthesis C-methylase UbiE
VAGSQSAVDWREWHAAYDDASSPLARRLELVRRQVRLALERLPPGPIRAISVCAGQGHDLIGVLVDHPRREDVSARLVELDEDNVARARAVAGAAGLDKLEIVVADASCTDAYAGAVPADLVLVCGVFGNVATADVERTIARLDRLCAPGAIVVWTRHRNPPDLVPLIRERFAQAGFEELAFEDTYPTGVGAHRLRSEPRPFEPGVQLFEFIGHQALWSHLDHDRRAALGALFRPDCSLRELVEAMRAIPHGAPSAPTAECMLREARGTAAGKHLFLAQLLAHRFPELQPTIVHRVYRLARQDAERWFGAEVAQAIPPEGMVDVHRYLTITLEGRPVTLDVTIAGAPWDGQTSLPLICAEGEDHPAGPDPDADLRQLEAEHCEEKARAPFLAALTA